ncbi:putative RING finger protein [Lachnellula suecica]|uniref:Putative RING finger protein n=1 Tax=Lachnellula suecica TaxID=602035 RepID=A0A8T9C5D2_9HELO|nr:putative RING finger protein [Lachnellula suecica]
MKFSKEFAAHLNQDGFPQQWVDSAVSYRKLKKIIKDAADELCAKGLDSSTLAQLLPAPAPAPAPAPEAEADASADGSRRGSGTPSIQYEFNGDKTEFTPKLTLLVENGLPVDGTLSPDTKRHIQNLIQQQRRNSDSSAIEEVTRGIPGAMSLDGSGVEQVEIDLKFDSQFFKTLQHELAVLEALQAGEQSALFKEIGTLSEEVTILAKPSKYRKTDMNRWRELFAIYIEANIFFSTNELDHGARNSATAAKQLDWFRSEVIKRNIPGSFKLPSSHKALAEFVKINRQLLLNIKFQEINHTAVYKIVKKFDKKTQLGAKRVMPIEMQPGSLMPENIAKAACAQLTQDLISKIPQAVDYSCPICSNIIWRPVRLSCGHQLCITCACELQHRRSRGCPWCRKLVVLEADSSYINEVLEKFLELHFPKEVAIKRIAVETEHGIQQFGITYKHPTELHWAARACTVM